MSTKYQGGFTTVTIARQDGTSTITAEKTGHPGLVITPALGRIPVIDAECFHGWTLTHVPSGRAIKQLRADLPIDLVRGVAQELTDTGIDWSRSMDDLVADKQVRNKVLSVCQRANAGAYQ